MPQTRWLSLAILLAGSVLPHEYPLWPDLLFSVSVVDELVRCNASCDYSVLQEQVADWKRLLTARNGSRGRLPWVLVGNGIAFRDAPTGRAARPAVAATTAAVSTRASPDDGSDGCHAWRYAGLLFLAAVVVLFSFVLVTACFRLIERKKMSKIVRYGSETVLWNAYDTDEGEE